MIYFHLNKNIFKKKWLSLNIKSNDDLITSCTRSPCMQCVTGVFSEGFVVQSGSTFWRFLAMNNIALVVISWDSFYITLAKVHEALNFLVSLIIWKEFKIELIKTQWWMIVCDTNFQFPNNLDDWKYSQSVLLKWHTIYDSYFWVNNLENWSKTMLKSKGAAEHKQIIHS